MFIFFSSERYEQLSPKATVWFCQQKKTQKTPKNQNKTKQYKQTKQSKTTRTPPQKKYNKKNPKKQKQNPKNNRRGSFSWLSNTLTNCCDTVIDIIQLDYT